MDVIWIILIVITASLIKGITGFGFALVALPPLLIWYSPKEIIPVLIACNLFASTVIVLQKKQVVIDKRYCYLIVYGAVFTMVGAYIFSSISDQILIYLMSVLFIGLSVLSLIGIKYTIKLNHLSCGLAGAFIGILTGSISISGPPLALFLHSTGVNNQQFREIFAWFSIVTSIIALISYASLGLLSFETLTTTVTFIPILYLGTFIGKRLNNQLSISAFKRLSMAITLISCVLLLLR